MRKIKNLLLGLFMRTKLYNWLVKDVIPYIRWSTYYALPSNPNFLKWGALAHRGYQHLQVGDIILTVDDKKLTTKFITAATASDKKLDFVPSHAAICVSKDKKFEVAEMTHTDFTKSTWGDVCYESTRVLIIRIKSWSPEYISGMMTLIPYLEDTGYDRLFKMGIESLSCSELPYAMDSAWNYALNNNLPAPVAIDKLKEMDKLPKARVNVDLEPVVGDEEYISPLGWFLSSDAEIIWDSEYESNS